MARSADVMLGGPGGPADGMPLTTAFFKFVAANWKYITGIGAFLYVSLGFNFKTPAQHFEAIARDQAQLARADSTMDYRITRVESYLKALAIAQCFDRPRRETAIMGLPCDDLVKSPPGRLTP